MNIGFTGHQRLQNDLAWEWAHRELNALLTALPEPLVGICSLAIGGDQLFAECILKHLGTVEVVVPFPGYETRFAKGTDRDTYRRLLNKASRVEVLARTGTDEESYFAAGRRVVDLADVVIALWNGKPAAGLGGTADVVKYARRQKKKTVHLDPDLRTVTS